MTNSSQATADDALLDRAHAAEERARAIIGELGIEAAWRAVGAEAHLVGSLRMGLLMRHRDIDFHVYSQRFELADSFAAMAQIARHPGVQKIAYANLLATEERCLEWHAWYADQEGALWQLDLIHLLDDSPFAGHFERVADRVRAALTPETRSAILAIKDGLPDDGEKVMGIEVYQAVLRDGVRDLAAFRRWRAARGPATGIIDWSP